jgi:hypothetical protein
MNVIDIMDLEASRRNYLSLAVCIGWPDGRETLLHHIDKDRRKVFDQAIREGATPIGVFWIFHDRQFGYVAGCQELNRDPVWERVFTRELEIMSRLLAEDPSFRNVLVEAVPRIH